MVTYQELISSVAELTGTEPDEARVAAAATVVTLANTVDKPDRDRLLDVDLAERLDTAIEEASAGIASPES